MEDAGDGVLFHYFHSSAFQGKILRVALVLACAIPVKVIVTVQGCVTWKHCKFTVDDADDAFQVPTPEKPVVVML